MKRVKTEAFPDAPPLPKKLERVTRRLTWLGAPKAARLFNN